jgi:hypothetical protein
MQAHGRRASLYIAEHSADWASDRPRPPGSLQAEHPPKTTNRLRSRRMLSVSAMQASSGLRQPQLALRAAARKRLLLRDRAISAARAASLACYRSRLRLLRHARQRPYQPSLHARMR